MAFSLGFALPIRAQLPAGWTDEDIGWPALTGTASYAGGVWDVTGSGSDIWNWSDEFHYAYQGAGENCVIIAKVRSLDYTDSWAKAGVMLRDSTDPSSMFAMVAATPANGIAFQWRDTTGGGCNTVGVGGVAPIWVKLVRAGSAFTGYVGNDGKTWGQIGAEVTVPMNSAGLAGLAVTAHNVNALATAVFSDVIFSNVPPPAPRVTGVYRELWTPLDSSIGNTLDVLTNTAYNPSWPDFPDPSYTRVLTTFEAPANTGMNYYGQRLRAFVVPPTNGNYTFWIASDDQSQLFLSTDETPANVLSRASVAGWTSSREWTKEAGQQSAPVQLEAGRRYYLEAIMQQGNGGDNLAVRWQLPDGNLEEPLPAQSDIGTRLLPFDGQETPPGVFEQTTNITVLEGRTAFFSVLSTNRAPVGYRWRLNGTPLNGASALRSVYAVSNVTMAMNGRLYACELSNSLGTALSAPALLTVLGDTNPPAIVRALNRGLTNVLVVFSENVEAASATRASNYVFTNGVQVTAASLSADNQTVVLTTSTLVYGSNYTLFVSGVRDQAATPNTIAANSSVSFGVMPYTPQDIGAVSPPGTATLAGNGLSITSAGRVIGGAADQFTFGYQLRTGDFDVATRLSSLSPSDVWAKGGLMARESLDPAGRFASAMATPAMVGSFFEWRDPAGATAGSSGNFPVNYPNTWLRLKRSGNLFTGFGSYDGQNWVQLGSVTISMPSQVYFGLAVSSGTQALATVAEFRDIGNATGVTVASVALPHEPPGPCSRKTPLVFSEIMYKPADRVDTNNLEFIEIYNSNPWFEDLSGYRLAGDSVSYTFPPGTVLRGGGFLVVAAAPDSLRQVYGLSVLGPYTGSLKKDSGLELRDERNALLLSLRYDNVAPWPVAADGTGHSLVLANPTYGEADPRAWDISDARGGSPGGMDGFRPSPLRNVVINEFLAHTDLPDVDYIELYNHSADAVDISGCILTDDIHTNTFVVPQGTSIAGRGFIYFTESTLRFALSAQGETLYFLNPDQSRVLDAVRFEGQENGVASGRWPDGAKDFYRLAAKTPGAANAAIRISDVVINELMYHPISNDDNDQYIELYNQGTSSVNLGGWAIDGGIQYTFATNTWVFPGGYLVLAKNASRLRTNYANLNLTNCAGDYSGRLSHGGERLALTMPDLIVTTNSSGRVSTNLIHIAVDEVTYSDGGRWGQWSDGGGSSLELVDPRSNHRLPSNWADSDETQKSAWVNIENTGVLDLGENLGTSIDYAQVGLLDTGECLVDNVEVVPAGGANLVANPTFEGGAGSWDFEGDHLRSSVESSGYNSARSLHIRASDRIWTGANYCQAALTANSLAAGQTATLRFKARWLHGWPEVLMRLNGNWLEAAGRMPVPANLGTPGARNSRYAPNAGPAIYEVTHQPAVPAANQPVVVVARVHDSDGVQSLTLNYRVDPSSAYVSVAMKDDGTYGDVLAGDGIFSGTIPGQGGGTIVAFYLSAKDAKGASSRFPAQQIENEAAPECVVMFGDGNQGGCYPVYHLWVTKARADLWSSLSDLSNETHDCTIVNGTRVIYNARARFAGSPYHQGFDTPYGSLCHYKWVFPDDDKFLGATSFNKLHQPGNGAGDDQSLQREQTANTFLRALGQPWLYRHHVVVYVNGVRRGQLMEDAQTPDADVVEENFPEDSEGWLYKMQPWFEFQPFNTGSFNNCSWCNMMPYTSSGGVKKTARYRWNFMVRRTPVSANDYTNVFSMVDAASTYGQADYVGNMEKVADMENWMRVFAANHAAGNWDAYGCQNSQNLYGYIGARGTRYSLLMFDFNIVLGNSGSWGPGQNLFTGNGQDPNTQNIYNEPTFRRMYWRALGELVDGPLDPAKAGPLLDAKFNAMTASGVNAENPSSIKNWIASARTSIATQIASENTSTFTVNSSVTLSNNIAFVSGTAPFNVKTIRVNGADYPVTWTSVTGWTCAVPLAAGPNTLSVAGVDMHGQPIAGATGSVSVPYSGVVSSPVGQVVLNEVMHDPVVPGADYVEMYNSSTNTAFDLSGCELRGLAYTFPSGAIIPPNSYLVLAGNRALYAAVYGIAAPLFDSYDNGNLQENGELLSLVIPGTNAETDVVITKVRYRNSAPWSTGANGTGSSLQALDPRQDNWRVGNWTALRTNGLADPQWVFVTTSVTATSSRLYIYLESAGDTYLDDMKLAKSGGANTLANSGFETALAGTWNLGPSFLQSALSTPVRHSGTSSLHLVATNAGSASVNSVYQDISPALSTNQTYTLSFWYLQSTNGGPLTVRLANSGNPATVALTPPVSKLTRATPGFANSVAGTLAPFPSLWLNEVQAENLTGPTNAAGERTPWVELFNPSTNTLGLDGVFLSGDYTNLGAWAFPSGATIGPRTFKLIFADGETNLTSPNELHAGFMLPAGSGSLALSRLTTNAQFQVLDYLAYTNLAANHSYGSFPDGQSFDRQEFFYATAAATNNGLSAPLTVVINEWMAGNTNTIRDPVTGKYEDWFELYNYGTNAADLSGYYLTHSLTNQLEFPIPAGYIIPAKSFLLVWADKKETNTADLHVNFKLSKSGASIGLYGGDRRPVDYVTFGPQTSDISEGRFPDGASTTFFMPTPTPGTNNLVPNTPPVLDPLSDFLVTAGQTVSFIAQAYDNDIPVQTLTFSLGAGAPPDAAINPSTGYFTWTPLVGPVTNTVTVVVSDNGIPNLSVSRAFVVAVLPPPQLGGAIIAAQGKLAFSVATVPGQSYQLESSQSLEVSPWAPVGDPIPGTGDTITLTNSINQSSNAFYRLRLLP